MSAVGVMWCGSQDLRINEIDTLRTHLVYRIEDEYAAHLPAPPHQDAH